MKCIVLVVFWNEILFDVVGFSRVRVVGVVDASGFKALLSHCLNVFELKHVTFEFRVCLEHVHELVLHECVGPHHLAICFGCFVGTIFFVERSGCHLVQELLVFMEIHRQFVNTSLLMHSFAFGAFEFCFGVNKLDVGCVQVLHGCIVVLLVEFGHAEIGSCDSDVRCLALG